MIRTKVSRENFKKNLAYDKLGKFCQAKDKNEALYVPYGRD